MTIPEINAAAAAEGISYGQYVDKHKDDPEPKTRACIQCGKEFPLGRGKNRKIYCSSACKDAYKAEHKKVEVVPEPEPPAEKTVRVGAIIAKLWAVCHNVDLTEEQVMSMLAIADIVTEAAE